MHWMQTLSRVAVRTLGLTACCLVAAGQVCAAGDVHWAYSGAAGPEHWGQLSHEFAMCGQGQNQSPINLTGLLDADLPPLQFAYQATAGEILNNGHTIQVNCAPGGTMTLGGHTFGLKQFHFHAPSENQIGGTTFPLEAHFVHADSDGHLAVIALMFEQGEPNAVIGALWESLPLHEGDTRALAMALDPLALLPETRDYYRFNGSLTTPPCSEGVWWLVMKETVTVSAEQVRAFVQQLGGPNNRPVMPVNARPILR